MEVTKVKKTKKVIDPKKLEVENKLDRLRKIQIEINKLTAEENKIKASLNVAETLDIEEENNGVDKVNGQLIPRLRYKIFFYHKGEKMSNTELLAKSIKMQPFKFRDLIMQEFGAIVHNNDITNPVKFKDKKQAQHFIDWLESQYVLKKLSKK